jgi:hypothetical protein
MVACVSAWVHPEQQFEECCAEHSLLPVVVSITQELIPLKSPSAFQWSLVQSSNLLQFCTPLPPSLHPLSLLFFPLRALLLTAEGDEH